MYTDSFPDRWTSKGKVREKAVQSIYGNSIARMRIREGRNKAENIVNVMEYLHSVKGEES